MSNTVDIPWGSYRPSPIVGALIATSRSTMLGRGSFRRWIAQAIEGLQPGPLDVRLWGIRVRLHPSRNVAERKVLLRPDRMDEPELRYLREVIAAPGAVFVDIGANAGLYALYAGLHAGEGTRVVLIEPQAALMARFRCNLALAQQDGKLVGHPRFFIHELAAGDAVGELLLSGGDGSEGSRSLVGTESGTRVKVMPLADILTASNIERVDIIKIDVEGFEDRVLVPFLSAPQDTLLPRHIIIEHVHQPDWQHDCFDALAARGFVVVMRTRNNTILTRPATSH
jgi:FkbM family methyltransferase